MANDRLNPNPRRLLTDRECASLLGGMISTLMANTKPENVVIALKSWIAHPEAIAFCEELTQPGRSECVE